MGKPGIPVFVLLALLLAIECRADGPKDAEFFPPMTGEVFALWGQCYGEWSEVLREWGGLGGGILDDVDTIRSSVEAYPQIAWPGMLRESWSIQAGDPSIRPLDAFADAAMKSLGYCQLPAIESLPGRSLPLAFASEDAGKTGGSGLDCDAFPQFPPLKASRVGTDTLVSLLEIHAPQEYLLAVRRAAQALEDDLAAGSIADVEAAFYRHQVSALSALCDPDEDGDREIPAVVLIERIAGALIHAAQLREAPGEEVRKVLPSRLDNLTAAGNVVSLAAGCSRVNHARLARKLQGMGLPCGP